MSTDPLSAGALRERVNLSQRETQNPDAPNDYGNTIDAWVEQGTVAAQYIHVRGSETVLAGRLAGQHTQVIRVRASALTRQVSTDWRVTDARTGQEFNVRDVTLDPRRRYVDLLCEAGVAA